MKNLLKSQRGQSMTEYILIIALIALVGIVGVKLFGKTILGAFSKASVDISKEAASK
ncbi:MAG: hypothetical protein AABY84_06795 [Candidatus Firestonebacteria bacterium]